jgi:hypothetical protein
MPECYVDDSKLFISFLVNNLDLAIDQINKDLDQLCCWYCGNSLLVNPEKNQSPCFGYSAAFATTSKLFHQISF